MKYALKTAIPAAGWWCEMWDPEKQEYWYEPLACFMVLNDPQDNDDVRNEYAVGECLYPISMDVDGISCVVNVMGKREKEISYTKVFYSEMIPDLYRWQKERFYLFLSSEDQ